MDYKKLIDRMLHMNIDISDAGVIAEAVDIISDYEKATAQNAEMMQRYEKPDMAIRRQAGIYVCPLCGKRTQPVHTHCHWCGKKLSWARVGREAGNNGKKNKAGRPKS